MYDYLAGLHPLLPAIGGGLLLALGALLADWLAKWLLIAFAQRVAKLTTTRWDDALIENHVLHRLALIVPGLVVFFGIDLVPGVGVELSELVRNAAGAWLVLCARWPGTNSKALPALPGLPLGRPPTSR